MAIFGKSGGPAPPGREDPGSGASFIGPKIRFQGELLGDEDVLVEGHLEDRVKTSKAFRVGPHGVVLADVEAGTIAIAGRIAGNVSADERVELLPTGILEGKILQEWETASSEVHPAVDVSDPPVETSG